MPPSKNLTLKQIIKWQRLIIRHDRWVIRTAKVHKPKVVKFHKAQLSWTEEELKQSLKTLAAKINTGFPPHHLLWVCISKYEGGVHSINPNGHYGMLQMHLDWGYGIVGAASNYSQSQQEWAAERGYAASNYSSSFLYGQWFNYDNAESECLRYA